MDLTHASLKVRPILIWIFISCNVLHVFLYCALAPIILDRGVEFAPPLASALVNLQSRLGDFTLQIWRCGVAWCAFIYSVLCLSAATVAFALTESPTRLDDPASLISLIGFRRPPGFVDFECNRLFLLAFFDTTDCQFALLCVALCHEVLQMSCRRRKRLKSAASRFGQHCWP